MDKAIELANFGVNEAKKSKFSDVLSHGYLVLSDLNQERNNYKLANSYLRSHIELSDSLLSVKRESLSPEKRLEFLLNNQTSEYQKQQAADLQEIQDSQSLSKLTHLGSLILYSNSIED